MNKIDKQEEFRVDINVGETFTQEHSDGIMRWIRFFEKEQQQKGYNQAIHDCIECVGEEKKLYSGHSIHDSVHEARKRGYNEHRDELLAKLQELCNTN